MSADLIGDDACREAFNKARQQRFSVHGLDVVCEPDIFRAGYAAGRDSEIAKRDARMAELEKELQAGATAVENCELFRAELAAIKAQEPAFMWHKGATEDESEVVDVDCACPCCVPLYAAPVSEAKAQAVVMPEQDGSDAQIAFWAGFEFAVCGLHNGNIRAAWNDFKGSEQFKRLNAAPVQQVSVPVSGVPSIKCWSCKQTVSLDDRADADGNCPHCCVELDLEEYLRAMLAAAPAAPAADAHSWRRKEGVNGIKQFMTQKCYDAQTDAIKRHYEPFKCANCKAADALLVEALDYQVLFDAIAAATSVYANGAVNISVQAFRDALAAHRAKGVV